MKKLAGIERGSLEGAGKMPPMTGVVIGLALCLPFWLIVVASLT